MEKNKLQEFADKSLEKYDNKVLREQIVNGSVRDNELVIDNRKRNWIIALGVCFLVVLLAFGTYMLWPKMPQEKRYLLENQKTIDVSLEEIANYILDIKVNDQYVILSQRIDDIAFNETLYYQINFLNNETGERLNITIVTNINYKYEFNHKEYDKQTDIIGLHYVEQYEEDNGIYMFNCAGELIVDETVVYAQYEGLGLEPQSNFINFLQQCIEIH